MPQSSSAIVSQTQSWSGPLPPPLALQGYESIVPGAADRILSMAETNNAFINDMDKRTLEGNFIERRIGQLCALIIALAAIGGSIWLASNGHEWTASVLGGTTVVGIVSIFVLGRYLPTNE